MLLLLTKKLKVKINKTTLDVMVVHSCKSYLKLVRPVGIFLIAKERLIAK